jgi:Xaa-Pro aminopeptidase
MAKSSHLLHIKKLLTDNYLDAALISSVADIIYLTNFSYFTDIEREAFLLITKDKQYIITDGRYSHAVKKYLKNFTLLEITHQKPFEYHLEKIIQKDNIISLGIETTNITVSEHKKISPKLNKTKHFDLSALRIKKDPQEIACIIKACKLADLAFTYICGQIKAGMTEKMIAFELESYIRKNGADISFPTIVAFGENAAIPHHHTGNTILNKNKPLLIDFGVKIDNYCSDMTRTIFLGIANHEQKKAYQTVLNAQQKAIDSLNHNLKNNLEINASDIDKAARNYIIKQGYPNIPHSLGHGIGLQLHESPTLSAKSKNILENGMVFSIEPGIYLPDKFGIRIEDLFVIQDNSLCQLTNSPKTLVEI